MEKGANSGPQELCRRGLGRDSESWSLGGGCQGRAEKTAGFGRKYVSGSWKREAGTERLGKRLPKVND